MSEAAIRYKFRPRLPKKQKDIIVQKLIPMPHNSNQVIVMDSDSRGSIWDVKHRKYLRSLPNFSGIVANDGKIGIHSPNKGGLHIVDMKTGANVKTLIGYVAEGVNDVQAEFTPNGKHILYYHNGHQTLRLFRVSDGGQDGSLLTVVLFDEQVHPEILKNVAVLPSRKYLAEHLEIPMEDLETDESLDLRNLA
uniref:NWD2 C-terminal beta-propeller domain-containing protein n=1 Tax=Acrobeloides nanus TaxID=290746 RepID=A0A914D322_9BILA